MTLSCRLLGVRVEASRIPCGWQVTPYNSKGMPLEVCVGPDPAAPRARLVTLGPGNWAGLASALGAMHQQLADALARVGASQ